MARKLLGHNKLRIDMASTLHIVWTQMQGELLPGVDWSETQEESAGEPFYRIWDFQNSTMSFINRVGEMVVVSFKSKRNDNNQKPIQHLQTEPERQEVVRGGNIGSPARDGCSAAVV